MKRSDLGLAAIERVFRDMAIDEEWSVREARGFTWWGAWLRQRLWADKAVRSDRETLWQVRARTAAYRDQPDEPATYALVNAMNADPATSAYVYDPDDATVSARCGAFVYAAVSPWLERFLVMSVALQASSAWLAVPGRAEGRALDDLPHPTSGPRRDPDDMLNLAHTFEAAPSPFTPANLRPAAATLQREGPAASFDDDGNFLSVFIPLAGESPAFWALSTIEHPSLGEGALARLFLPRPTAQLRAEWLANALNLAEVSDWRGEHRPHALGAWTAAEGRLVHSAFFPGGLFGEPDGGGALMAIRNLLVWGAVRARFATERLAWLETAARSRYPDDEAPESKDDDPTPAGTTTASTEDCAAASSEPGGWRAVTSSGPAARVPRPPRAPGAPRHIGPDLVVDRSDPAAFDEIDDAVAAADDGDRVRVRPGRYGTPVVVDRAVSIEGDGELDAIVLEPTGGEALAFFASGATVDGLTIRPAAAGNDGTNWSAIWVRDVVASIERCNLASHLGATVAIVGPSSRVGLVDCLIHDGAQNGVSVSEEGSVTIDVSRITGNRWPGVLVSGAHASAVVRDSTVEDNRDWGIAAQDGATLVVERTTIARNAQGGITLAGAAPASRIEDCDVTENAEVGIRLRGGRGGQLVGNRVRRNSAGVLVTDGATPTISRNEIADNGGPGIWVHVPGTDPLVQDNAVTAGPSVGIGVSEGARGRFERNRVAGGEEPGIWVRDAGSDPVFVDNSVTGGTEAGVAVSHDCGGTFMRNDLRGNAGGSWRLDGCGRVLRSDNREDAGSAKDGRAWASPDELPAAARPERRPVRLN